jgi:squalene synthase HpnC
MNQRFARELERYGPGSRRRVVTPAEARMYCSNLARTHYENFTVASLLLPRRLVRHFHNVYAYCRWADDLADETGGGARALELLRWWGNQLRACYGGEPTHPVMIALRETILAFKIPKQPFLDLLFAFEQDQLVKRYRTFDQLLGYCRHSANPVGHLVLYLFELYDEPRAKLADSICTGLQLANFWQDLARDLAIGRIYLPLEDQHRFGYPERDLLARRWTPAFRRLMEFEVDRTRELFHQGSALLDMIPEDFQPDIELFIQGGLAILDRIESQSYDVWTRRPTLSKLTKGRLFLGALWRHLRTQWSK